MSFLANHRNFACAYGALSVTMFLYGRRWVIETDDYRRVDVRQDGWSSSPLVPLLLAIPDQTACCEGALSIAACCAPVGPATSLAQPRRLLLRPLSDVTPHPRCHAERVICDVTPLALHRWYAVTSSSSAELLQFHLTHSISILNFTTIITKGWNQRVLMIKIDILTFLNLD